jgi:uncharacterized protein YyaL (SSP411 family)
MAYGGIYDQVGGGFARYSTDTMWKVPHFEKMLYDNAQLLSLYAEAYRQQPCDLYRQVCQETLQFLLREMLDEQGVFYSALDADTEGEEGKFYLWTLDELRNVLADEFTDFSKAYHLDERGYWEHGQYILLSAEEKHSTFSYERHQHWKQLLLEARSARIRPGTDDKIILSWNAMLIRGLAECYLSFHDEAYRTAAERCMQGLLKVHVQEDGRLLHTGKTGKARIDGFLDDYACFADACFALYQVSSQEVWLSHAGRTIEAALKHFHDPDSDLLFYTSSNPIEAIGRKKEVHDNVTPSSNSMMAYVLHEAGLLLSRIEWEQRAERMLRSISGGMEAYGSGYSRWGSLALRLAFRFYQVGAVDAKNEEIELLQAGYHPDKLYLTADSGKSSLDFFRDKTRGFYVCADHQCSLPVSSPEEALDLMKS